MSDPTVKVLDVTELSQIVACNQDYYNEHKDDQTYEKYTAFLVNTGIVEGEETPTTELFYGDRRVSNLSIIKGDLPNESPDGAQEGRLYLTTTVDESSGKYYVKNLYIYLGNAFVPLLSNGTFINVAYDASKGTLDMTLGDGTKVKLFAAVDGMISTEIKNSIIESVITQLKADKSVGLVWSSF